MKGQKNNGSMLTFGGHMEVLRQMLYRILAITSAIGIIVFCFKKITWQILLAPSEWSFCTYRWIENIAHCCGFSEFHFTAFHVDLIATDLSSQFMTHVTTTIYLALLGSSPYIIFELIRFISPALYESEKKISLIAIGVIYFLFVLGVLMSYYVIFPISFRFLGTYCVADQIHSTITLSSYIDTFITLTIIMGLVFQLPVIAYVLSKMKMISSSLMSKYRKHSLIIIMLVAAVITPPDIMTLIIVTIPLYLLFELSIRVVRWVER